MGHKFCGSHIAFPLCPLKPAEVVSLVCSSKEGVARQEAESSVRRVKKGGGEGMEWVVFKCGSKRKRKGLDLV